MFKIRAKHDGFRRVGEVFFKKAKDFPDDYFSDEQIEQLMAEPELEAVHLPDQNDTESDKKETI